jgi:hypothetical protein
MISSYGKTFRRHQHQHQHQRTPRVRTSLRRWMRRFRDAGRVRRGQSSCDMASSDKAVTSFDQQQRIVGNIKKGSGGDKNQRRNQCGSECGRRADRRLSRREGAGTPPVRYRPRARRSPRVSSWRKDLSSLPRPAEDGTIVLRPWFGNERWTRSAGDRPETEVVIAQSITPLTPAATPPFGRCKRSTY